MTLLQKSLKFSSESAQSNAGLRAREKEVIEEDLGHLSWGGCAGWFWGWVGRHGEETRVDWPVGGHFNSQEKN